MPSNPSTPTTPPPIVSSTPHPVFTTILLTTGHTLRPTQTECSICLEPIHPTDETQSHTTCRQAWHDACLEQWLLTCTGGQHICPLDREVLAHRSESYHDILVSLPGFHELASRIGVCEDWTRWAAHIIAAFRQEIVELRSDIETQIDLGLRHNEYDGAINDYLFTTLRRVVTAQFARESNSEIAMHMAYTLGWTTTLLANMLTDAGQHEFARDVSLLRQVVGELRALWLEPGEDLGRGLMRMWADIMRSEIEAIFGRDGVEESGDEDDATD